ncbi:Phage protein [Enterobacter intestinihominis]
MKSFNEWMNEGRAPRFKNSEYYFNKRVVCADGFSISIQANNGAYCQPRCDIKDISSYYEFELGFPSDKDESIMQYAEDPESPVDTVYPYVPRNLVEKMIESHGGIVAFAKPKAA